MNDFSSPYEYSRTVQRFADAFIELHGQIITIDECEDIVEQLRDRGLTLIISLRGIGSVEEGSTDKHDPDPLLTKLFNTHGKPE